MENQEKDLGEKAVYELSYLILPSIPEDKLPEVVESIKEAIIKDGGIEIDEEEPFKHPLAYPMSKTVGSKKYIANDAFVGWVKFEIEPSNILGLQSKVEKISEMLRFLIVKAPRKTEFTFAKAKAAIKAREEKERQDKQDKEDAEAEAAESTSAEDVAVPTEVIVE